MKKCIYNKKKVDTQTETSLRIDIFANMCYKILELRERW